MDWQWWMALRCVIALPEGVLAQGEGSAAQVCADQSGSQHKQRTNLVPWDAMPRMTALLEPRSVWRHVALDCGPAVPTAKLNLPHGSAAEAPQHMRGAAIAVIETDAIASFMALHCLTPMHKGCPAGPGKHHPADHVDPE